MFPWDPILKKASLEPFETSEAKSQTIVGGVFIGVALMILATVMSLGFYWAYQRNVSLFIAITFVVVFLYALKMVILVAVLRKKLNEIVFKLYIGSTVFMALMSLILFIYFLIRALGEMRSSSSSVVPSAVKSYLDS